jgi:hypothetical protein
MEDEAISAAHQDMEGRKRRDGTVQGGGFKPSLYNRRRIEQVVGEAEAGGRLALHAANPDVI